MNKSHIVFLVLFFTKFVTIFGDPEVVHQCGETVTKVVEAIEKAVGFFSREYQHMNLDALFGLRIAEGQLSAFLQTVHQYQNAGKTTVFKADIVDKVDSIRQMADDICLQAIPTVKRHYPQDYSQLGALVTSDNLWDTQAEARVINKRLLTHPSQLSSSYALQESITDSCFSELLGSSKASAGSCSISKRCWDLMSAPGYGGYSLTHQILYFQIAIKMDCIPTMKKRFGNQQLSPETLFDKLCADEYAEAESIANHGFPEKKQDLFMEQGALCGLLGYKDFYRQDWIDQILTWQDNSGCFKNESAFSHDHTMANIHNDVNKRHRSKRRESVITETGCLNHKTAVALSFLGTYLRLVPDIQPDCFSS